MEFDKSEETGYILEKNDEDRTVRRFSAVRAGMSWPRMELGLYSYFCVLGEEVVVSPYFEQRQRRRGKIFLLYEWVSPDIHSPMEDMFIQIIAAASRYKFQVCYAVTEKFQGEDFTEHARRFQDFVYGRQASVRLETPGFADNLELSVDIIRTWKKKGLFEIPDTSIVAGEMEVPQTTDVKQIAKEFNALNALRLAMCGFYANPPPDPSRSNFRKNMKEGSWKAY